LRFSNQSTTLLSRLVLTSSDSTQVSSKYLTDQYPESPRLTVR
jgi:hypothetical protein